MAWIIVSHVQSTLIWCKMFPDEGGEFLQIYKRLHDLRHDTPQDFNSVVNFVIVLIKITPPPRHGMLSTTSIFSFLVGKPLLVERRLGWRKFLLNWRGGGLDEVVVVK